MNKRNIAGLISGAVLLSGALAGTALAHHDNDETSKSSIAMVYKQRKGKFVGQVGSGNAKCLAARTVGVFKARTGAKVGTATTNTSGGWSVAVKKNSGRYYSKVTADTHVLEQGNDKYGALLWEHTLTCTAAKSDVEGT